MSDEDLRSLERRFRETGAPDDQARWYAALERASVRLVAGWPVEAPPCFVTPVSPASELLARCRTLAALLAPGFEPPATVTTEHEKVELQGFLSVNYASYRAGDERQGFHVRDEAELELHAPGPTFDVTIEAYGLPPGTSFMLHASTSVDARLEAHGPAERIAALRQDLVRHEGAQVQGTRDRLSMRWSVEPPGAARDLALAAARRLAPLLAPGFEVAGDARGLRVVDRPAGAVVEAYGLPRAHELRVTIEGVVAHVHARGRLPGLCAVTREAALAWGASPD